MRAPLLRGRRVGRTELAAQPPLVEDRVNSERPLRPGGIGPRTAHCQRRAPRLHGSDRGRHSRVEEGRGTTRVCRNPAEHGQDEERPETGGNHRRELPTHRVDEKQRRDPEQRR